MKNLFCSVLTVISTLLFLNAYSQAPNVEIEPDFVGEAYLINPDGTNTPLNKEIAGFTQGISFKSNSYNALSLEIPGGRAKLRIPSNQDIQIVVRAVDNQADPLSIITLYKLDAKSKKRTTLLSKDNTGTLLKSRTNIKNQVAVVGAKFGTSSYLLKIQNLTSGEYGLVVNNPNSVDEKRTIISCFGID